jgi:hypothetical protein
MALSGIRTFKNLKTFDDWLNEPYFEGVREFLKDEKFEPVCDGQSFVLKFWAKDLSETTFPGWANAAIKITICAKSITMIRLDNRGQCSKGFFRYDDELPHEVRLNFLKTHSFKDAYNSLINYMETTWKLAFAKYSLPGDSVSTIPMVSWKADFDIKEDLLEVIGMLVPDLK